MRVESKIQSAEGNYSSAMKKLLSVKKLESGDLKLLGNIITDMKKYESKEAREAVAFYEDALGKSEWDAEDYVRLADIMYENNEKERALTYYKIAYKKDPENEWVAYRVGDGSGQSDSIELFTRLQKSGSMLSSLAKTRLIEINLRDKLNEVY